MGNWLTALDDDDREEFFSDLRNAAGRAEEFGDVTPIEKCLREWRTTAQALTDPRRREVLTAGGFDPGDFIEVGRP